MRGGVFPVGVPYAVLSTEGLARIRFIIEPQVPAELICLIVDCEAQSLGLRCDCCKLVLEFGHTAVIELTIGIKAVRDAPVAKIVSLLLEFFKFRHKGFVAIQMVEDADKFSQ